MAASCGLSVETKNLLNDYKADMSQAIILKPLIFLQYGLNDAVLLEAIF